MSNDSIVTLFVSTYEAHHGKWWSKQTKRKTNKREIVRKWTVNKHSDLLCVWLVLDGERNTFCILFYYCLATLLMNDGFTVEQCWLTAMSAEEHVFFYGDREAGSILWSFLIFDVWYLWINGCVQSMQSLRPLVLLDSHLLT